MNVSQLRESIVELLGESPSLLGKYEFPDGTKIDAVYVVGRQSVPSEWKIEGLAVTIQEIPEPNPRAILGGGLDQQTWVVTIVDYLPPSTDLIEAIKRMKTRFPDAEFAFRPETKEAYGQVRITIPDTHTFRLAAE